MVIVVAAENENWETRTSVQLVGTDCLNGSVAIHTVIGHATGPTNTVVTTLHLCNLCIAFDYYIQYIIYIYK